LFRKHWETKIDKELRHLLSQANALMSISEYMSKEYYYRYGMEFIPFHNPIDVKHWLLPDKTYEPEGAFKLLYAGRIGTGLQNSLLEVAAAVGELNTEGLNIVFHIQATNDNPVLKQLGRFEFVSIRKPVPYNELPLIFGEADLLLLPNDFDQKSVSFLKYSMPTKASEYMASGTPILVYSSIETAVTRHALQYHWAVVVSQNKKEVLKAAIKNIYADKDLRMSLGNSARELAIQKFDSNIIRANFKSVLLNSIGKKNLQ
jgi:glycosyltransferase involved in cell wall biosynthesis